MGIRSQNMHVYAHLRMPYAHLTRVYACLTHTLRAPMHVYAHLMRTLRVSTHALRVPYMHLHTPCKFMIG